MHIDRSLILAHSHPMEPIPTGQRARLDPLPGIRAVLWDVYGTLLVSGSGDVGTARETAQRWAMAGALAALGLPGDELADEVAGRYFSEIEASHARSRSAGVEYPELHVPEVWQGVLERLVLQGRLDRTTAEGVDPARLALEYELRANPCWPMPAAGDTLAALRSLGLRQGIVSNAQFFTPEILTALLGSPLERWGIDPTMQFYSFRFGCAKPGIRLFELAAEALAEEEIPAEAALYVGNDMRNDVAAAAAAGFRTALFAGDARSLRLRADAAPPIAAVPDAVITDLAQLPDLLRYGREAV